MGPGELNTNLAKDYKDPEKLRTYISDRGKIESRHKEDKGS